jgi:hypothetical protein
MFNILRVVDIIHMNVRCAEMMSSEIANLTILVEVQNAKTFYEKNM